MADDGTEYLEACKEARDALYDLLMLTEPDLGQHLRVAYSDLKKKIAADEGPSTEERQQRYEREKVERLRGVAWKRTPMEQRAAFIFQSLGEERLTIGELTTRVKEALKVDYQIYESNIRAHVTRMYNEGDLQRKGEEWHSRVRYRYFRKRTLEGPIADLQAQFEQEDEA